MENAEMMHGLEDALKILTEQVPVLDAWIAIKAVKEALTMAKNMACDMRGMAASIELYGGQA